MTSDTKKYTLLDGSRKTLEQLKVGDVVKVFQHIFLAPEYKVKRRALKKKGKKIVADVPEKESEDHFIKESYIDFVEVNIPVLSFQNKRYYTAMLVPSSKEEAKFVRVKKGDMGEQVKRDKKKDYTKLEGEKEETNVLVKRGLAIMALRNSSKTPEEFNEGMNKIIEPLLAEKYKVRFKKQVLVTEDYALIKNETDQVVWTPMENSFVYLQVIGKSPLMFDLYRGKSVKIIERSLLKRLNPPFKKPRFPTRKFVSFKKDKDTLLAEYPIKKDVRDAGKDALKTAINNFKNPLLNAIKEFPENKKSPEKVKDALMLYHPLPLRILVETLGNEKLIKKKYPNAIIGVSKDITLEKYAYREYENYIPEGYDNDEQKKENFLKKCKKFNAQTFAEFIYNDIYLKGGRKTAIHDVISDFIKKQGDDIKVVIPFIKQRFPFSKITENKDVKENLIFSREKVLKFIADIKENSKKERTKAFAKSPIKGEEVPKKDKKFNKLLKKRLEIERDVEELFQEGKGSSSKSSDSLDYDEIAREIEEELEKPKKKGKDDMEEQIKKVRNFSEKVSKKPAKKVRKSSESDDEDESDSSESESESEESEQRKSSSSSEEEIDEQLAKDIKEYNIRNKKSYANIIKIIIKYLARYKTVKKNSVAKFLTEIKPNAFSYKGYKNVEEFLYEKLKRFVRMEEVTENGVVVDYKIVDIDEKEFPRKISDSFTHTLLSEILNMLGLFINNYYYEYHTIEKLEKGFKDFPYLKKYIELFPKKEIKKTIIDFLSSPQESARALYPDDFDVEKLDDTDEVCEKYLQIYLSSQIMPWEKFVKTYSKTLEKGYKLYEKELEKLKNAQLVSKSFKALLGVKKSPKKESPKKELPLGDSLKGVEEKIYKSSKSTGDYLRSISRVLLYLGGTFKDVAKMFYKKLERGVYTFEDLPKITMQEFLPEVFLNASLSEKQSVIALQKIMDEVGVALQILTNRIKSIRNPTEKFGKLVFPTDSSLKDFALKDVRDLCTDKNIPLEKLVISKNRSKSSDKKFASFYCFNQDELYKNFQNKNYKNKYTKKDFDKEFVTKFIKIYTDKNLQKIKGSPKKVEFEKKPSPIYDVGNLFQSPKKSSPKGETFKLTLFKWDDGEWVSQGIKQVYLKLDKGNNIYNLHVGDSIISLDDVKRKDKITFPIKSILFAIKKDEKLNKLIKKAKKYNKKQIKENAKEIADMMENL